MNDRDKINYCIHARKGKANAIIRRIGVRSGSMHETISPTHSFGTQQYY